MLTIPPTRKVFETERAVEIQAAEQAMARERLLWYFAAIGCVLGGTAFAAAGLHVSDEVRRTIWLSLGLLLGDVGPVVILVVALHREER